MKAAQAKFQEHLRKRDCEIGKDPISRTNHLPTDRATTSNAHTTHEKKSYKKFGNLHPAFQYRYARVACGDRTPTHYKTIE